MYRFAAFSWNSRDSVTAAAARQLALRLLTSDNDWECVLDTPGLQVFHAPQPRGACHAYVLERGTGVVLGRLFEANLGADRIRSDPVFDDKESRSILASRGRCLVERYWGHYVAFLREWGGERHFVVRDPTGGLPCFLTRTAGIDVMLSDMEDCARLGLTEFSVDWDHITAFFLHMRLVTRTTGFKEVTQLYAGECVAFEYGPAATKMTRSFHWNPVNVYQSEAIEDPGQALWTLRDVIQDCVHAWASCYDSIVHELSGGLDSSIVAACLANASSRPDVLCFHYYTEMAEGDERPYARLAAHSAGWELIERQASATERTLESQLNMSKLATPALAGLISAPELLKQQLVTERLAGSVFTGQGGDHLFQEDRDKLIAAEYAYRHGIRLRLFGVVGETARLTKESYWSVLRAAFRYGLLRRPFDPYAIFEAPSILSNDALTLLKPDAFTHPWVESASRLPASKLGQVLNIVDCQPFYLMPCPYAEQIHPLISQPVIERCLKIPTYILTHRGMRRGLVREAFEAEVPTQIIRRQSKGGTTSYLNQLLVENAPFVRQFLLDGSLVKEGILDRRKVEKHLSEGELIRGDERRSILNAARAEAWLSTWTDVRQRTAA